MRRRAEGFTFVEVLVSLAVATVVLAGLYQAFNTLHRWWISSTVTAEQRRAARAGLETVTRDLEMAGYHTTNYGDPEKTGVAITLAAPSEIEVDQQRPTAATLTDPTPVFEPRLVYYHLATDLRTGRQHLYRQVRTQPGLPTADEIVAENVGAFTLAYYDADDAPVAGLPPAAPAGSAAYVPGVAVLETSPLKRIRRIEASITTVPTRAARFGPAARNFTLRASVTPPNLATVDEVALDTAAPAPPANVEAIDTRSCGAKLRVRWDRNPEPDLEGYMVFYGPTGYLLVPVRALADPANPEITLNPEDLVITRDADRASAPNTYAIQVAAYDSAGNHSAKSAAVSGDPSPDVTAFGGADDTTVNPAKPSPPTGLAVAAGAADGELVVTWSPPADGTATTGFRLYRSTAPFPDGHVDDALQIAGEDHLAPATTTWTDTGLEGCRTYYYAVASVNCDDTLVAGYQHDGGDPAAGDYSAGSGAPVDRVAPPAPSLAGSLAEVQRVLVTLENPLALACPDFDRTEVYWSEDPDAPPVRDAGTGAVTGGLHVPDSDAGSEGVFRARGSQVFAFDDEILAAPPDPILDAGATYHLLAVSYDRCGNVSPADARSFAVLAPADACVDDPAGPPPASFSAPAFSACQPDAVELGWSYPGTDVVADLAGFRVARTGPAGTVELTAAGPTLATSWTDAGPLEAGGEYTYTVTASDCVWERYRRAEVPLPYLEPLPTVTLGPIRPGGLRRYEPPAGGDALAAENFVTTVSDVPASYTYHNNVRLWLQNTSRSPVTLRRMAVTWDKPGVVLERVVIGGGASDTPERVVELGGVASGTAFAVDARVEDVATGIGSPSGPVPLRLRFTTGEGTVSRLTNMRSETLGLALWAWNESLQETSCPATPRLDVDVPRGPVLGGFSQSAPGRYGIDSYPVLGPAGTARDTDVRVPNGVGVNVYATAFDNSRDLFADGANRGFTTLKVVATTAPPAAPAAVPAMPTSGTFLDRPLQGLGGNRYAVYRASPSAAGTLMPAGDGEVVWYYGLVIDATGNWDRSPHPDYGAYAYHQAPFDPCAATPRAPVLTLVSAGATEAVLAWEAPTHYEDGVPISPGDPLTYDLYAKGAGGDPWPSLPAAANLTGLTYTHVADLLAGTHYYMVVAKNSCATEPRLSAPSNVVMECAGATGVDCTLFAVPATAAYDDPIALAADGFCDYRGNGAVDSVVFRVTGGTTTDFAAPERGDDGAFAKTVTAVWTGGGGDAVAAPGGSLEVRLVVAGSPVCEPATVTLTGGECFTTPGPPTSFTAVRGSSNSGAAILGWFRPNFNTDGTALTDLAGYEIESARCAVFNAGSGNCTTWSAWVGTVLNDPVAQAYTWSGLVLGERYKFRMRAKDRCATPEPNVSAWTAESGVVRVR